MQSNEDLWYRLGYALETARSRIPQPGPTPKSGRSKGSKSRALVKPSSSRPLEEASHKLLEAVLAVGAGTVASRLLSFWPGRHRPGILGLLRGSAAGAAAAFLAEVLRPLLSGEEAARPLEDELTDILLSGVGRGLLYAAVVEPRIPGPAFLKGSAYGALEYALTPWGGLEEVAGSEAPHRKLPILAVLLRRREDEGEILQHLVFGIVLAILSER